MTHLDADTAYPLAGAYLGASQAGAMWLHPAAAPFANPWTVVPSVAAGAAFGYYGGRRTEKYMSPPRRSGMASLFSAVGGLLTGTTGRTRTPGTMTVSSTNRHHGAAHKEAGKVDKMDVDHHDTRHEGAAVVKGTVKRERTTHSDVQTPDRKRTKSTGTPRAPRKGTAKRTGRVADAIYMASPPSTRRKTRVRVPTRGKGGRGKAKRRFRDQLYYGMDAAKRLRLATAAQFKQLDINRLARRMKKRTGTRFYGGYTAYRGPARKGKRYRHY